MLPLSTHLFSHWSIPLTLFFYFYVIDHMRSHVQEKRVGCPTCGGLFTSRVRCLPRFPPHFALAHFPFVTTLRLTHFPKFQLVHFLHFLPAHFIWIKVFYPKKLFLSSWKYDLGCSSRIRIPDPHPGSRGRKGTGSRIRIRNTVIGRFSIPGSTDPL